MRVRNPSNRGKRPSAFRHPEVRARTQSGGASKGDGPGRASFENPHPTLPRKRGRDKGGGAPQDDGSTRAVSQIPTTVQIVTVTADESGMRVDRFLEAKFPGLS